MRVKKIIARFSLVCALVVMSVSTHADHSWGNYHWARTTSSFDLTIINSTTSDWDGYVSQAISDWSDSTVLNMVDLSGNTNKRVRRQCKGGSGKVRICNLAYGQNGWLGIAGISIDSEGHITTGYTKLNDSYFSWVFYDKPGWKQSVTCQELGHNVGLGHQDADFNNESLVSCMDYQNPPHEDPNDHDYEQLAIIYGHTDDDDTYDSYEGGGDSGGGGTCNAPPGKGCNKAGATGNNRDIGWGASLGRNGNAETFIRIDHDGTMHLTYVTWAIGY